MASQTNDNCWLVVWNMNFIFQYLGNVIIPNDFQSIIFPGRLKHQPDVMFINENMGPREDMEWQQTCRYWWLGSKYVSFAQKNLVMMYSKIVWLYKLITQV
jgi:hypothetical protein